MASAQPSSSFAELLKRYRGDAGLTQEELAERANLSVRSISDLERGVKQRPHRTTVDLIVSALALPPERGEELRRSIRRVQPQVTSNVKNALPAPVTRLIGRDRDVQDIVHRLRWSGVRLLTVTGPGGVGKTRVAVAAARALESDPDDGLFYLSLAPLREASLVPVTLLHALGVPEQHGQTAADTLISYLRDRDTILVLDNLEHLPETVPLLSRLLQECSRVKLLVTSRTATRIQGEQRFELVPLEIPEHEKSDRLEVVGRFPAIELFVERARAARRGFELSDENLKAVVEICSRLDGLPLAIELAAARVSALTPQSLVMRIDQRLQVLTGGGPDLPDRQQTMADAIAWSYHLLDRQSQRLFRWLSAFAGWSMEAAEFILDVSESGSGDLLPLLSGLVDNSMVQVREAPDGTSRFSMLETLREYGMEQLRAEDEFTAAREAHAFLFLQLAEEALGELAGPEAEFWLNRLKQEEDNFREALGWLAESGKVTEGVQLSGALWRYWYTVGSFTEGRSWLSHFLDGSAGAEIDDASRARALFGLGAMAYSQSDLDAARASYEASLQLWRALHDVEGIAMTLNGLGILEIGTGNYSRAESLLRECVVLRRRGENRFGLAAALNSLANVVRYEGDLRQAVALYEESLSVYRELGTRVGVDITLNNLAQAALITGDYDRARTLSQESLLLGQQLGRPFTVAQALMDLGNLAIELGDLPTAEQRYQEALDLYLDMGDKGHASLALVNQANLARAQGDYEQANRLARESLLQKREMVDQRGMAFALLYLGDIAREQGQFSDAAAHYHEALRLDRQVGFPAGTAECLEHLGWLLAAQDIEHGVVLLAVAQSLRTSMGMVLTPAEQRNHGQAETTLTGHLGEEKYRELWQQGLGMEWQTVVDEALTQPA